MGISGLGFLRCLLWFYVLVCFAVSGFVVLSLILFFGCYGGACGFGVLWCCVCCSFSRLVLVWVEFPGFGPAFWLWTCLPAGCTFRVGLV